MNLWGEEVSHPFHGCCCYDSVSILFLFVLLLCFDFLPFPLPPLSLFSVCPLQYLRYTLLGEEPLYGGCAHAGDVYFRIKWCQRTYELMEGRLPTSDGLLRRLRHLPAHCSFVSPRTGRADPLVLGPVGVIQTRLTPASLTYNRGSGSAEAPACMHAVGLFRRWACDWGKSDKGVSALRTSSPSNQKVPRPVSPSLNAPCAALSTSSLLLARDAICVFFAEERRLTPCETTTVARRFMMNRKRNRPPSPRVGLDAQEPKTCRNHSRSACPAVASPSRGPSVPEHLKTLNETATRLSLETVFLPKKLTARAQDESLRDNEEKLRIWYTVEGTAIHANGRRASQPAFPPAS